MRAALSERLGVSIIPVVATDPRTVKPLLAALDEAIDRPPSAARGGSPGPRWRGGRPRGWVQEPCRSGLRRGVRVLLDRDGHVEKQFVARGGVAR